MKFSAASLLLAVAVPAAQAYYPPVPPITMCETGWALDGSPASGDSNPQCFLNANFASNVQGNRWGWYLNDISTTSQSFEVWAGAAGCGLASDGGPGQPVGTVNIQVVDGECVANFTAGAGVFITDFQLYCGSTELPVNNQNKFLTNPGGFQCVKDELDNVTSETCTVDAPESGPIFAALHVTACPTGGVEPAPTPVVEPAPTPVLPPGPGIDGDPHVLTWNGKWFDYMGQCDMKMLSAPKFDGHHDMDIDIRTTVQYDYSFIEAAAIRIGKDVLEVGSYGDFAVNGVDTPYMGGRAGRLMGYEIHHTEHSKKKHTYDIVLSPTENITLASYKNLVSVHMNVNENSEKYFGQSEGLMGSYSGDLLARDGATVMDDTNAFGQEWQVTAEEQVNFRTARAPQYPQKCVMPSPKSTQRRLGETIAQEAAEAACAHKVGAAFSNCVYDVMAIGDLDIAKAGAM